MTSCFSAGVAYNECSTVTSLEETTNEKSSSSSDTVAAVAKCVLTVVAIVGNLAILVAIVRSPSLRVQLTNLFIINLCVVDLVAASLVMPMSLVGLNTWSSSNNTTLSALTDHHPSKPCTLYRLLSTFVAFASVLSVALANVERYVSIRHPMLHAAHLTVGRTLAAVVIVWAAAVGVAITPVVADWHILDIGSACCAGATSSMSAAAVAFLVVVLALLFVAPTFMMAAMCCCIYRVARQAGRRVVPSVSDGHAASARSLQTHIPRGSSLTVNAVSCCAVQSSASCPTLNSVQRHNNVSQSSSVIFERRNTDRHPATTPPLPTVRDAPECIIQVTCHQEDVSASPASAAVLEAMTAGTVADRRWKAAATLLFVLLTFVPLWSPYFAYSLYRAVEGNQASNCGSDQVERAVVWIGFTTFASNAFVYGWMNRAIRDVRHP